MATTTHVDTAQLEQLQTDLARAAQPHFEDGTWPAGKLLEGLAGVIDYVRRITLPTAGNHYQAEKSWPLVREALDVELAAMSQLCSGSEPAVENLRLINRLVCDVHEALRPLMWSVAEHRPLGTYDTDGLRRVVLDRDDLADARRAHAALGELLSVEAPASSVPSPAAQERAAARIIEALPQLTMGQALGVLAITLESLGVIGGDGS